MSLFRRRRNADGVSHDSGGGAMPVDEELNEQAKDVMKDNLELMRDIVMKIRDDPDFAANIYTECPRLQHLLDQYPDLRPIFEDPKLVRINFEQVYRDAGGVLPEDEEKRKPFLVWLVNSPIFKIFKFVLFIKKVVAFIAGGGFAFLSGCIMGCCFEDALEEVDVDLDEVEIDAAKEALNKAADHMEDPAVQEQMQALLEDPENLQEAIENDPELKALRDSNPLCEELMSDPETMRVLTDPDNLRALGDAPSLIELDFADPDGFVPPDIETGGVDGYGEGGGYDVYDGGDGMELDEVEADADFDLDVDEDIDEDVAIDDGFDDEVEVDDGGGAWLEDVELEEQEQNADGDDRAETNANAGRMQARGQAQAEEEVEVELEAPENTGRFGGIMAVIGAAATDLIAAQIVGNVFSSEMMPDMSNMGGLGGMGGGDMDGGMGGGGLDPLGGGGNGGVDINGISEIADDAGNAVDDDLAAVAEDTVDKADEKAAAKDGPEVGDIDVGKDDDGKKSEAAVGAAAAAGGASVAVGVAGSGSKAKEGGEDGFKDEEEPDEDDKKKARFGLVGDLFSAVGTKAKEYVAGGILGDDFGEALVARQEEGRKTDKNDKDDEEKPKRRGIFRRGDKTPE